MDKYNFNLKELKITQELLDKINKDKISTEQELSLVIEELAVQVNEKENKVLELAQLNLELKKQVKLKETNAAELKFANKELESFSYSVSHDLRTPLRAINGFVEIILEDYRDEFSEDSMFYFDEIRKNAQNMGELIDNLLEFSRIAKKSIVREEVRTESLVNNIINELNQLDPQRVIQYNLEKLLPVMGDKFMLKQAFYNLIQNAYKYTSKTKEAKIEIGSYKEEEKIIFFIKDNGSGFDEKYAHKLFGAFQRLHSSEEFEGTGIGLAIVEKIITKHNGKIWANSQKNKGASFYFSIPIINS